MAAISRRVGEPSEEIIFGFGAHRDPRVALSRALTELNQLFTAALSSELPGRQQFSYVDATQWWNTATINECTYLVPDPAKPATRPGDYGYLPCDDIRDDVEILHAVLRKAGMELLVLDQTRPDIALPVVKVIVPGMRHFWARFAPGRLYDVPVKLGRCPRPTEFDNLNPFPLFV
jgi:ribosomal protein S12 methylthiotransferase accessory factor